MKYIVPILTFFLCLNSYSQEKTIIKGFQGLKHQKRITIDINSLPTSKHSFHFLLPCIGRSSIFGMLDSLEPQVQPQDFLTIVFDAKDKENIFDLVKKRVETFSCTVRVIFEKKNLGFWGHGVRNKYANSLKGDFILHCDDDDIYLPNAISTIRKICTDKKKLYIFKIMNHGRETWQIPKIYLRNISTQCGVIPASYNKLGKWAPFHGGDFSFYKELSTKIRHRNIIFIDFLIYKIRPD